MERSSGGSSGVGHLVPQTVLDQLESAVIVVDSGGDIRYANPYAEQMFGVSDSADYLGRSVFELGIDERERPQAANLARRVLRGHAWDGTFTATRTDGRKIYVRAHAIPLRSASGEVEGGEVEGIVIVAHPTMKHGQQRDQERYGLLQRISEQLTGSLELDETLTRVTETLVPQFADHCFIDLFENDKLVRRASTHVGNWRPTPGTWADVGEPVNYPDGHFADKAMRRQETIVVEEFDYDRFPAPSEASAKQGTEVGLTSVISAPLCARDELLGVMSLALSHLGQRTDSNYDTFDRDFIGAIASRVAIAVDNAMLFEAERSAALAFQTALLPSEVPEIDGLQIAWRYSAAKPLKTLGHGIQTQVGGDWYDVIPLSAGRVGIVIGDVEGHGPRAAATMGQLRAAVRAFAQDDRSPPDVLRELDGWVRALARPDRDTFGAEHRHAPIVTCIYMVYDAWSRQLSFANAGHAPPLLLLDGKVEELDMFETGVPLGVRDRGVGGDAVYREETRDLRPGSTLVLYTDGLVERRIRHDAADQYWDEDTARAMLRARIAAAADADVEGIATAAEQAVPGDIDDDVAILVIRAEAEDLAVEQGTFPARPIMVSRARKMAAEAFAQWGIAPEQANLACLLISEVVTNVVLHTSAAGRHGDAIAAGEPAGGESWQAAFDDCGGDDGEPEFRLRLRLGATSLWVEVFDTDLRLPRIRRAGANDEGGRGLYLIDQLTTRWGSRPTADGKAVWFEIPVRRK